MRELDFATERRIAEAFEEIKENFEDDIADQVDRDTADMLNGLLQIDAQRQLGAGLYERTLERAGYRCGSRPRRLVTPKGTYDLRVPRSREVPLRFRLFARYLRLWRQVDELLRQTYLGGCSTRQRSKTRD